MRSWRNSFHTGGTSWNPQARSNCPPVSIGLPRARDVSAATLVARDGRGAFAWGENAADTFASVRAQLERRGTPIGVMDTMIAAHALAVSAVLVTNTTKHFRAVTALSTTNWARKEQG